MNPILAGVPINKPSLCFVAHHAFGALSGKFTGHIGGVERQQSFMARWFAARGYRVSMLTWDEGHPDGESVDGVRVFNICGKECGIRGVRFIHPRWTGLNHAMQRAGSDLYYQNCAEYVTGQVALWCRMNGKAFIYSVASDPEVDPSLPEMKTYRERILYRYGLRHANQVVVQTRYQQKHLHDYWGMDSTLIPMPGLLSRGKIVNRLERKGVLWVGRIDEPKRLEWLLEIAKGCPDLHFDIVGRPHGRDEYIQKLETQISLLRNVVHHGYIPPEKMPEYYARACVLCCTSRFEGFPNTFLEAWSYGVPIILTMIP